MSGLGALRKLAEKLLRQADAGDPRLLRAVEQGYDLEHPMLHGTNRVLRDEDLDHLFLSEIPEMAMNYSGGGRRAGPRSRAGVAGPNIHPLLLKGSPYRTELDAFDKLSYEDPSWVRELGITDPEAFQAKVRALNAAQQYPASEWITDPMWGAWHYRADSGFEPYDQFLFNFLDNEPFRRSLLEEGVSALDFRHPYTVNQITPKGKVKSTGVREPGRAVLAIDPSALRSPFAEFKEEGVGLMKKKGGLASACDCKQCGA